MNDFQLKKIFHELYLLNKNRFNVNAAVINIHIIDLYKKFQLFFIIWDKYIF